MKSVCSYHRKHACPLYSGPMQPRGESLVGRKVPQSDKAWMVRKFIMTATNRRWLCVCVCVCVCARARVHVCVCEDFFKNSK